MIYRGNYKVRKLAKEFIPKIKEIFEKWKLNGSLAFCPSESCDFLEIHFDTNDPKKVFKLAQIIEGYGGKVKFWIDKLGEERTHEQL